MNTSVSGQMKALWNQSLGDGRLEPQEYQALKQKYLQAHPQVKGEDADKALLEMFRQGQALESQQAEIMVDSVKMGSAISVQPFFLDDDVHFSLNGVQVEDQDGLDDRSQGDLKGHADQVSVEIPLTGSLGQGITAAAKDGTKEMLKDTLASIAIPTVDIDDNLAENLHDTQNPDSWWNIAYDGAKMLEHGVENASNWVIGGANGGLSTATQGLNHVADDLIDYLYDRSELSLQERDGQKMLVWGTQAQAGEDLPGWIKGIPGLGDEVKNLFGNTDLVQISTNDQGQLDLEPFPNQPLFKSWVDGALQSDHGGVKADLQGSKEEQLARGISTSVVKSVQGMLSKLGVKADFSLSKDGHYLLTPQSLTINAENATQILGPAQAAQLGRSELTLTPQDFALQMTDKGLKITLKNAEILGSSDKTATPSKGPQNDATSVDLAQGEGTVHLDQNGDLSGLSLQQVVGSVQGQGELTPELVDKIKTQVVSALDAINKKLERYGISKEQLSELLSQIPTHALEDLVNSGNTGDVAELAKNFGVSGETLAKAMDFLRQEPLQQIVNDFKALTDLADEHTALSGQIHFDLKQLELQQSDQGLVAQLAQLKLRGQGSATTTAGVKTDLSGTANTQDLQVDTTGPGNADVTMGASDVNLSAQTGAPPPPLSSAPERVAKFVLALQMGQDYTVASGSRKGYLVDEPPHQIRSKKGLTVATAVANLKKATAQDWAALAGKSQTERLAFYQQKGIPASYGEYLNSYLQEKVLNNPQQTGDNRTALDASAHFDEAHFSGTPGDSHVDGAQVDASLTRVQDGAQTDLKAQVKLDQVRTDPDDWAEAKNVSAQVTGRVQESDGTVTNGSAQLNSQTVTARSDENGQGQVVAQNDLLKGQVSSQGQDSPVLVSGEIKAGEIRANNDEIRLVDGRTGDQGLTLEHDGTHVGVHSDNIQAVTSEDGLTADSQFHWDTTTSDPQTQTDVALSGDSSVAIRNNRLKASTTTHLSGDVTTRRAVLLNLMRTVPALNSFADYLDQKKILSGGATQIQIRGNGPIRTNDKAQVTEYDVGVSARRVRTQYGDARLNFRVQTGAKVSGSVDLNPSAYLAQSLRDSLNETLKKHLSPGSAPIGVDQLRIEDGKLKLSLNHKDLSEFKISLDPSGDHLTLKIDKAQIRNGFVRFFAGLLGIDSRQKATEQVEAALRDMGAQMVGDQYTIQIPTDNLLKEVLGPDLGPDVRIRPDIRGSQLHLDFAYSAAS